MATTSTQPTWQLQVRRVFPVSPERLFRAWTTPEELKRWHAPDPLTVPLVEIDLRVGGSYRIHMREPGGIEHRVGGTYRVVDPPRRLVYTWKHDNEDTVTQVTLEFKPQGSGTELVLTHEGFPSEDDRNSHEQGWTSILERVARELGGVK
ncbi:MAG TPA: SRPBCC domain-containing protein [Gemmatimonadales bacterium]|jgi:uncharacterized protein YndB with AHSA1/START domain|nr:SRPBCC domain-containing protein [Gemmatimonadales bacterium]